MSEGAPVLTSFIGGHVQAPRDRVVSRENPARKREIAARWSPATAEQARAAMQAAAEAWPDWSRHAAEERHRLLDSWLNILASRKERLRACITRENGKTLAEAEAEIDAGVAEARYLIEASRRSEAADDRRPQAWLEREPVGPMLLITPWNFPLATILRKLAPALVHGNTAVVKASELTPGASALALDALTEAGAPAGVANLVLGFGGEIGEALVRHPALRGVSFTGSTRVGLELARTVAAADVRLQLEMGGKNTTVVLEDADLDLAAEEIARGAFSCAGQWCTGTSRVVVERAAEEALGARLAARATARRVAPGDQPGSDMGPLATAGRVHASLEAIDATVKAGARLVAGGRRCQNASCSDGHFLEPTVLGRVTSGMPLWNDELFAPVLAVAVASDAGSAIELANSGSYGLSASVFSRDTERALSLARRIEAGMIHVNLHTAHRDSSLPVGGWRESGRGIPECGSFSRDFFTRARAVYVRR